MIKIFNIKLFIFIYFLLNPFELLANIWEGTIDNKKVILVYNGVKIDGKLKKTFRMRLSDLCIYGNINFPKSPPDYRFEKDQSLKNPIGSWNYHWAMAFSNANGSNSYKIKRCKSNWENFVNNKNIIPASGYQDNKFESLSDDIICKYAVYKNVRRSSPSAAPYVKEAKRRMLSCFLAAKLKKENKDSFAKVEIPKIDELKFRRLQDQTICKYAVYQNAFRNSLSASPYVKEAKRRGLKCGINNTDEKKTKQVATGDQNKKLKEEKSKIISELAQKEKLEKKQKNKISRYKNKAANLYDDITKFVKLDNTIDLIKLSDLYSKRPKINEKWSNDEIDNFENLLKFLENNNEFIIYQKSQNKKRRDDYLMSKEKNLSQLKLNLKQLKKLLKENFDSDKKIKEINSINLLILDFLKKEYDEDDAKSLKELSNDYLKNAALNNLKNKELDAYFKEKKVDLVKIVKNQLGSEKSNTATKFLKLIDAKKSLIEKQKLKIDISSFLSEKENSFRSKLKENKIIKRVQKKMGPCSDIKGGWGKAKCLTIIKLLPINLVCRDLKTSRGFDGIIEVNILEHDNIFWKLENLAKGKVKRSNNNLLYDGSLEFNILEYLGHRITLKIKIDVGNLLSTVPYEQLANGRFVHSGYCQKRL